jgi:hypothetical protein
MIYVGLCVPHANKINPEFLRQLQYMQMANPLISYLMLEVDMMIIGKARTMCLEMGLAQVPRPDVFWFIDDDVMVPPHAHVLIDQAMALGVVSGTYYSRREPYTPQVYMLATEPQYEGRGKYWPKIDLPERGLYKVDAVGGGCLAIRTDVLLKMKDYYRELHWNEAQKIENPMIRRIVENLAPWFEFLDKCGEDMYFCEHVRNMGGAVWVNADVQCTHVGENNVGQPQFNWLKANTKMIKLEEPI